MAEEIHLASDTRTNFEEQTAIDGFRKLRRITRTLKLTVGIVTGLMLLCFLSVLARVYVIGRPMSTAPLQITSCTYSEETDDLTLHGTVNVSGERVKRVVYRESDTEQYAMNVLVYTTETVPFLSFLPAGQNRESLRLPYPMRKDILFILPARNTTDGKYMTGKPITMRNWRKWKRRFIHIFPD